MTLIHGVRRRRAALALAIAPLTFARHASAANKYYVGAATGVWNATASWSLTAGGASGAPVPVTGDLVYLTNTTGLVQTLTYNVTGSGVSLGSLTLDATGGTAGNDSLVVPAGTNTLTVAGSLIVGNNGTGTINQAGGTVAANLIYLGYNGGSGSVILSGGLYSASSADSQGNSEYIGYNLLGSGNFTQTGGTHNVSGNLVVGNTQYSTGTYTLNGSAAKLTVLGNEFISYLAGSSSVNGGNFYQMAGTHVINGTLSLGEYSPAAGFYSLTGGTLQAGAGETIGDYGYGDFYQAGTSTNTVGSPTSNQVLTVGNYGDAEYDIASAGITLTVYGNEIIGKNNGSYATFYQVAGAHAVSGFLSIGDANGANGTMYLSGGTLSVGSSSTVPSGAEYPNWEIIGAAGSGSFVQTGGTNTVGSPAVTQQLEIGYGLYATTGTGVYTMSGSASYLNVYGSEYIGDGATGNANQSGGAFYQSGGTHNVSNAIYVGNGYGATGYFGLGGGNLNAYQEIIASGGGGYGDFEQTGGTNTIITTGGATPGLFLGAYSGDYGIYTMNGSTAVLSAYDLVVGGTPTAAGGTGVLNILAGTITASQLKIWNTADSAVYFSGGSLTVGSMNTSGNPSNFYWTGGTLTIQSAITIDSNFALGQSVALNLGMTLIATGAITNNGTINFAGGTLNSSGSIVNNATVSGYGTIIAGGGFTNNLQITEGSGNITLQTTGTVINSGTITLATGHSFAVGAASLSNSGALQLNGGSFTGTGTLTNSIGGTVTGPGLINMSFANTGVLSPGTGTLNIIPVWTNNGVVEPAGITSAIIGGAITNNGTIQGYGGIGSSITNNGTIESLGGTLVLGTLTNPAAGTIESTLGGKILASSGLTTNAGLISLTGGIYDNGGYALTNTGQITGYGTLSTGGLTNAGHFTLSGTSTNATTTVTGNVTNNVNQTISIQTQPAIFTGNIVNNGTIVTIGTTVTFAGSYSGNAYISDPSSNVFESSVTIVPGGSMTGAAGDKFIFLSGTVANNGSFINAGTLASGDNFTNNGTFNQSGSQTWYPNTTFTNIAGTAVFGGDAGAGGQNLSFNASGGSVTFGSIEHLANLNIGSGATAVVANAAGANRSVLFTPVLTVGGTLDLTTNAMDLQSGGTTGLAAITSLVKEAYSNGLWTGTGITSSSAADDRSHLTAIGVLLNNTGAGLPIYSTFEGAAVALNDVLVKYTYYGDANLDGKVDGSDYTGIDNGFANRLTGWSNGDFNYDGVIDGSDYALIDNSFNTQGVSLAAEAALPTAQSAGAAAVPEPTSLVMLSISGIGLLRRRKLIGNCLH